MNLADTPILGLASEMPRNNQPGVYFLTLDERVVYVGQSTNPAARMAGHKGKTYDVTYVLPVEEDRLNTVEAGMIAIFKPMCNYDRHNKLHFPIKREDVPKAVAFCCEMYGLEPPEDVSQKALTEVRKELEDDRSHALVGLMKDDIEYTFVRTIETCAQDCYDAIGMGDQLKALDASTIAANMAKAFDSWTAHVNYDKGVER